MWHKTTQTNSGPAVTLLDMVYKTISNNVTDRAAKGAAESLSGKRDQLRVLSLKVHVQTVKPLSLGGRDSRREEEGSS